MLETLGMMLQAVFTDGRSLPKWLQWTLVAIGLGALLSLFVFLTTL